MRYSVSVEGMNVRWIGFWNNELECGGIRWHNLETASYRHGQHAFPHYALNPVYVARRGAVRWAGGN